MEAVADRLDRDVEDLLALVVAHGARGDAIRLRPVPVLEWASVRLRPLTEAECYARCYGGRREERVSVVRLGAPASDGRGERPRSPESAARAGAEASEAA